MIFNVFESQIRRVSGSGSSPVKIIYSLKCETMSFVPMCCSEGFNCHVIPLWFIQCRHDLYICH